MGHVARVVSWFSALSEPAREYAQTMPIPPSLALLLCNQ